MEKVGEGKAEKKPNKINKYNLCIGVLAILLISSAVVNAVLFLQSSNGSSDSEERQSLNSVCGIDDINKSNEILSTQENPRDKYGELVDNINKRNSWGDDINCRFVSFQDAVLRSDIGSAEQSFKSIEKMSNSGIGVDIRFNNVMSLQSMKSTLDQIRQGSANLDASLGGAPDSATGGANE